MSSLLNYVITCPTCLAPFMLPCINRLVLLLTVMPHVLRALPAVPPCLLSCLSFLIPYVLPNLTCCILYKPLCSLSYVPLCLMSHMFFVIYMLYVPSCSRTLVSHMCHVPLAFRAPCTHLTFCALVFPYFL